MEVRELLAKLVSFPVLGGQSNLEIIHFIENYLRDNQVEYTLVPNEEGTKKSLHCRIGPAVDGGIILSGHTDVVPVKGQPWETDPFTLAEKDGRLYGRGSCDMKGFLACCLTVLPEMKRSDLKRPIYFAFSYDEEIGCLAAPELVAHIDQTYEERPRYAIIGEPSEMITINGQKGIGIIETTVTGSQGHSSRIKQEVSAVHVAAKLIVWLENYMDELIADKRIDNRFTPPHTSLHIGKIHGGIAANVIAGKCTFTCDVRSIPRDDIKDIYNAYLAYCDNLIVELKKIQAVADIQVDQVHPIVPALDTDQSSELVDLVQKLSGNEVLKTVAYAAEAGQFAEGGFESVICGPGSIEQAHRANEFIAIEQLEKGVAFIRNLTQHLSS